MVAGGWAVKELVVVGETRERSCPERGRWGYGGGGLSFGDFEAPAFTSYPSPVSSEVA